EEQGEGGVRVQAPLPDRQEDGEPDEEGLGGPGADVPVPARAADPVVLLPRRLPAVQQRAGDPPGAAAADAAAEEAELPGSAGVGRGDGPARGGEVRQGGGV